MRDTQSSRQKVEAGLGRRRRKELLFKFAGMLATTVGIAFLAVFFVDLFGKGASAFTQSYIRLDVELSASVIAPDGEPDFVYADFDSLARKALADLFPEVEGRNARRELNRLLSVGAGYQIRDLVENDSNLIGTTRSIWVPASANVDMFVKGNIDADVEAARRPLSDAQLAWIRTLQLDGQLESRFNSALFANGDSRDPELAGIKGALMGSFYMLVVTLVLAFPVGVAAAVYLEEFAPRSRMSDLIEVNINNLAAVPRLPACASGTSTRTSRAAT
jgi:phosphate transport system permease protein